MQVQNNSLAANKYFMIKQKDRKADTVSYRSFFKKVFYSLVCSFVVYWCWLAFQLVLVLVPEGDKEVVAMPSYKGDKWYISFTHSVEKTAWEEFFTVNSTDTMTMTHTRFESLGWGYPSSLADGEFNQTKDNKFQMIMNRPYKEVPLRISKQAMQHIVHGKKKYNLVQLYGDGTVVTIKTMRRYQYWLNY